MSATSIDQDGPGARTLTELTRVEALQLLSTISYGRVVFTRNALPAIRPVNHVLDNGEIIIRTRLSAKFSIAVDPGTVVAYEADQIDPDQRTGWSVVVTGVARQITEPDRLSRYEQLLQPWVDLAMDVAIGIQTDLVTGFRFGKPD
jgi:nitroimidazol reductase NimA-like FMN-containing flavoprotein (pyridoxamine 5'-phosphate oxidase superfamily)